METKPYLTKKYYAEKMKTYRQRHKEALKKRNKTIYVVQYEGKELIMTKDFIKKRKRRTEFEKQPESFFLVK